MNSYRLKHGQDPVFPPDLGILKVHFSRAMFLDRQIIAEGPVAQVLTAQTIARAYGFEFHGEEDLSRWLNG